MIHSIKILSSIGAIVLLSLGAIACKSDGSGATPEQALAAWKAAGLEAGAFSPVDAQRFGGGECQAGTVSGLETTLCRHPNPQAATAVRDQALKSVGQNTGYALTRGGVLVVVADRKKSDPSGKTMNQMAKAFQAL